MVAAGPTAPCPTCGRAIGVHLVAEWLACAGRPWEHLDYEDTDSSLSFSLDGRDVAMADTLTARALAAQPMPGLVVPVLLLTFATGVPGQPPRQVSEVGLIGSNPDVMRKFGKLLVDTARGAANAVERLS